MITPKPYVNEYEVLSHILTQLKEVATRENTCHQMDQHLTPSMYNLLVDEIIPLLENELDYEPTDDELTHDGEPPVSVAEIHHKHWLDHQKLHS